MRLLIALLIVSSTAAQARDLSRQPYPLGELAMGMGGAFIAMTGDGVSTYYNPAGLAAIRLPGVSLSASAYQYGLENSAGAVDLDDFSTDMESTTFSTFPASIVYVIPVGAQDDEFKQTIAFSVLVPDRDQLEARLRATPNHVQFEMQTVLLQDDTTYWIGPSYAAESGKLRFGISTFVLVHQTKSQANIALKAGVGEPGQIRNSYASVVQELSGVGATALAQIGAQSLDFRRDRALAHLWPFV